MWGPHKKAATVETGSADRVANMHAFAAGLLGLSTEAAEADAPLRS